MNRRHHSVTLLQATQESPSLARLTQLSDDSLARLKAIKPHIPLPLQTSVTAGPIDGLVWCLIVKGNAAGAKIRQILPTLLQALQAKGWEVKAIRIKVQVSKP